MGDFRHTSILVTSFYEDALKEVHRKAREIFADVCSVSDLLWANNGFITFVIAPDGGKIGRDLNEAGERARKQFIEWFRAQPTYFNFHWVM